MLLLPSIAQSDILEYDPELDMALGIFDFFTGEGTNAPVIKPGPYFGAYLSMKSPIFTYFFNSENIYNIFELGCAVNEMKEEFGSFYMVNVPLSVDFAYNLDLFPKFAILPFVGFGVGLIFNPHEPAGGVPLYPFIKTGVEIRYLMWKGTHLRFKIDYGIAFVNEAEEGFVPFLKVRFPIPFIP
jgi:hypothetical protein